MVKLYKILSCVSLFGLLCIVITSFINPVGVTWFEEVALMLWLIPGIIVFAGVIVKSP